MNEMKSLSYSSTNVSTSAYVKLGSVTTIPVNRLLVSDTSGQIVKLAVDDGAPIAAVAATLVDQTITYTSKLPGAEGNTISVTLSDPGAQSTALAVSVSNEDITVSLQSGPNTAATASLATTTPIVFTSVASGTARNTQTIETIVNAAAANPTNTILVTFAGTAAAITITITPNDGTHNGAVAVNLTTANLVQLVNSGIVTGKTITLTDASNRRTLQTATGGDTTNLAHSGEGDLVTATFSGGLAYSLISIASQVVTALAGNSAANGLVSAVAGTPATVLTTLSKTTLSGGVNTSNTITDLFQVPVDGQLIIPLPSSSTIPVGSQLYLRAINATANSGFHVTTLLS